MEAADGTTIQECNAMAAEETLAKRKEKFIVEYLAEHLTAFLDGELTWTVADAIEEATPAMKVQLFTALAGMAAFNGTKRVYSILDAIIDAFLERKAVEEFEMLLQAEREAAEDLKATEGY